MRADLLALTADDLAALTNRGTVKRASKELDGVTVREAGDGTVVATAEDAEVTLPAGAPLEDARCSCPAVGLCRHIVRAVLAYAAGAESSAPVVWDPGSLDDAALAAALRPAALRRGSTLVARGVTATVVRSAKPMALLHDVEATVRFLVPHDLAYARCDCADAPPCEHVVPAVHAFRALDPSSESGVVELGPVASSRGPSGEASSSPGSSPSPSSSPAAPSPAALSAVDAALSLLAEAGLSGTGDAVAAALRHAERAAREDGRPWPADVCAELADLVTRHAAGDAAFDPVRVAQLVGEAVVRVDALRAGSAPALFVGGPRATTETEVGGGRLVGLGTRVRRVGTLVEVDALVYDTAAHRVLALGRAFGDPDDAPPRPFADLAATTLQRSISIAGAGAGQLVATGGKRSPGGRLKLGRRPAALSAQRFEWGELLGAPTLVEGVAEARSVRSAAAPPPLGPRTAGANVVVIPLAGLTAAGFHPPTQSVLAHVTDPLGDELTIAHPFSHRAAGGAERLLAALDGSAKPLYVAGELRLRGAETVITPVSLVLEFADGVRRMVQPAVDRGDAAAAARFDEADEPATPPGEAAVREHLHDLQSALGDLFVGGAGRADRSLREAWTGLADSGDALGSVVLAGRVRTVADALAARAHDAAWTPTATASAALSLAAAVELAAAL